MADFLAIPEPGVPLLYGAVGDPLVIVVHDEYGRLPWLVPYAEALADRGGVYVVVPDLFDGVATDDQTLAVTLREQLSLPAALDGLLAEIAAARTAGSTRAGVVGFSLGGELALRLAQTGEVDAVVAHDATLRADQHGIVPCPVMLNVAERREWPETGSPESFVSRLREDGTPVTRHGYDAVRGFANASIPTLIDPDAAALAFARTTVFLETHLSD